MPKKNHKVLCSRIDGRKADEMRPVKFQNKVAPSAYGSTMVQFGKTQVICAASVEETVPNWMRTQKVAGGWVTAEYCLLPYATAERTKRESSTGKVGGRTQEIQRLIGRALRSIVDLEALGPRTVWIDCDVIQADGGTRTAAITGGYVALQMAVDRLLREGKLQNNPIREPVAAVSVGVVGGKVLLDLNYAEDSTAEVDMNVVMTGSGRFVEIQGSAEKEPFVEAIAQKMLRVAKVAIKQILREQRKATGID